MAPGRQSPGPRTTKGGIVAGGRTWPEDPSVAWGAAPAKKYTKLGAVPIGYHIISMNRGYEFPMKLEVNTPKEPILFSLCTMQK
ncbi:hypothetical protein Tco_0331744 [Tanacetum coccineum]